MRSAPPPPSPLKAPVRARARYGSADASARSAATAMAPSARRARVRSSAAPSGHRGHGERGDERQVDGAERLQPGGEREPDPRAAPPGAHRALGREQHERQVHRRLQLQVAELRRAPGREAEEHARDHPRRGAPRPGADGDVHRERGEREAEEQRHLVAEHGVARGRVDRREERQVAEEMVRAGERPRRGVKDVRVEQRGRRRAERVHVPGERPDVEEHVGDGEPSERAVQRHAVDHVVAEVTGERPGPPCRQQAVGERRRGDVPDPDAVAVVSHGPRPARARRRGSPRSRSPSGCRASARPRCRATASGSPVRKSPACRKPSVPSASASRNRCAVPGVHMRRTPFSIQLGRTTTSTPSAASQASRRRRARRIDEGIRVRRRATRRCARRDAGRGARRHRSGARSCSGRRRRVARDARRPPLPRAPPSACRPACCGSSASRRDLGRREERRVAVRRDADRDRQRPRAGAADRTRPRRPRAIARNGQHLEVVARHRGARAPRAGEGTARARRGAASRRGGPGARAPQARRREQIQRPAHHVGQRDGERIDPALLREPSASVTPGASTA